MSGTGRRHRGVELLFQIRRPRAQLDEPIGVLRRLAALDLVMNSMPDTTPRV
jgi:hypothetical protein